MPSTPSRRIACSAAIGLALYIGGAPVPSPAEDADATPTLAEKLFASYDAVETLTCSVRKKTEGPQQSVTLLSRITFRRPDHIHVENVAPARRRIIADGEKLYYHVEGAPRGFSRPIRELSATWLGSLRNVPASPMENLRKLQGITEQRLPGNDAYPLRAAYDTERLTVVLSCMTSNRLSRVDFYTDKARRQRSATYEYSQFVEAADGTCALPCLHKAEVILPDGTRVKETHRFTNVVINEPVADRLFAPDLFFDDVEFVDDFEATLRP